MNTQRLGHMLVLVVLAIAVAPRAASAAGAPDLTVARTGPRITPLGVAFVERLTVTNKGTAATPGVEIDYTPGGPVVTGETRGVGCTAVLKGHSGKGGGYTRVGWSCVESIAGGLAPGASTTVALFVSGATAGSLTETFAVLPSPSTPQLDLVSHVTTATVSVFIPPAPSAPTGTTVAQVRDQLNVSWTPAAATAADLTSSLITATPTGGSSWPALSAVVGGAYRRGSVPGLEPTTTYSVTVSNHDAGGTSAPSVPVLITTPPSTVHPAAPLITHSYWTGSGTSSNAILVLSWNPEAPGDSPIDQYQVSATTSDFDTTQSYSTTVPGSATEAALPVDDTRDWSVEVRAHNAAGWGGWSSPVIVYALN